jgi:hypothetical protein
LRLWLSFCLLEGETGPVAKHTSTSRDLALTTIAQAFLLFKDVNPSNWSHVLLENRNSYSALREHYLKYIKHPELLNQLSLDPLADDPDVGSPPNSSY